METSKKADFTTLPGDLLTFTFDTVGISKAKHIQFLLPWSGRPKTICFSFSAGLSIMWNSTRGVSRGYRLRWTRSLPL